MILPGEVAPAHATCRRRSGRADGEGAYTAVEGEKSFMSPGDFVITATGRRTTTAIRQKSRCCGSTFSTSRGEFLRGVVPDYFDENDKMQKPPRRRRFAGVLCSGVCQTVLPIELKRKPGDHYTYARTRPILDRLRKAATSDKSHGVRVRYANPITAARCCHNGSEPGAAPKGLQGRENIARPDRTIFVCTEGGGTTKVRTRRSSGAQRCSSWCRLGSATRTKPRRIRPVLDFDQPAQSGARHLA